MTEVEDGVIVPVGEMGELSVSDANVHFVSSFVNFKTEVSEMNTIFNFLNNNR